MRQVPRLFPGGLREYAGAFEHLLLEEVRAGVAQALEQAGGAAVYGVGISRVGCMQGGTCLLVSVGHSLHRCGSA
jgi:hypothetical protein